MLDLRPKIVYLFGAGATHAELSNIVKEKEVAPKFLKDNGLLMAEVSRRVTKKAKSQNFFKSIKMFSVPQGSSNIELLISLIENNANKILQSSKITSGLKKLVRKDIERVLKNNLSKNFYLYKALLELDKANKDTEEILGYISLNYDTVLDQAYCEILSSKKPNYCISPLEKVTHKTKNSNPFLLKLHGSFRWVGYSKITKIPIIPLGVNKNYLQLPYSFIWGYAHEILKKCDILRIIGCSLNQNDSQLIDLLFKAHLHKKDSFEIHVIDFDENGQRIKGDYEFFPKIKTFSEIFGSKYDNSNTKIINESFQNWLKYKAAELSEDKINETKYLKKLIK
ncbi:MAG: SIR2 family protein [Patescibacteria group bacterium]|nr:SIR2 family protein [Patescibacteria group bacterium]